MQRRERVVGLLQLLEPGCNGLFKVMKFKCSAMGCWKAASFFRFKEKNFMDALC